MFVLILECAPPKVIGFCSSWALQVSTGVYVANLPRKHREEIWDWIETWGEAETRAVMVWSSPDREQGLDFRIMGKPRRTITEREGLLISTWFPRPSPDLYESPKETP